MTIEHRRNDFDGAKPKYSEKNRPQCHFFSNKIYMRWRCFNIACIKSHLLVLLRIILIQSTTQIH